MLSFIFEKPPYFKNNIFDAKVYFFSFFVI
jgi:hypothetical protein